MMLYYDFRFWSSYCGPVNPVNFTPFKAYYSFYTFGQLYSLGQCVECSCDGDNVYALAATDGEKKALLIVNHNNDSEVVASVSAENGGVAKVFAVDEQNDFAEIEADVSALAIPANAIRYIEFE
jgi:hypothetical protein